MKQQGERLEPRKVKVGRKKELDRFEELGVYEAVPRSEALKVSDCKFLKTRWLQSTKGGEGQMPIRSARVRVRGHKERFVCLHTVALCRQNSYVIDSYRPTETVESHGTGCLKRISVCPLRQETFSLNCQKRIEEAKQETTWSG